jgi:HlyD family secretion protein
LARHTPHGRLRISRPAITLQFVAALVCLSSLSGCAFNRAEPTPTVELQAFEPAGPAETPAAAPQATEPPAQVAAAPASNAGTLAVYSGNVRAEDEIDVAVEVIGQVLKLNVEVGDSVQAGDVLLELERTSLEARRAQALAGLEAAQAQLDLLLEEPNDMDLEAARAAVAAAEAAYQRALDGPTAEDLRAAEAQLRQAEAAVGQAQAAYDQVKSLPNIGALPQSLQLQQATLQAEAARAQYDKLVKGASEDVIAGAYAQLSQARAQLDALEQGPKDGQIRAAEAQVRQAETTLYLAQIELEKATVRAPSEGIILRVGIAPGAMAAPGPPVFTIQSQSVQVEIAVEETQLSTLRVGQPAEIRVNAYPDQVFDGEIAIIAPALDPATRTVQVTIRPLGDATQLLPGMFASVTLLAETNLP